VKYLSDRLGGFVAVDPCKRDRTVEDEVNLTVQGYCASRLALINNDPIDRLEVRFVSSISDMLMTPFAPLIFGTAAVLAILLFFSLTEH